MQITISSSKGAVNIKSDKAVSEGGFTFSIVRSDTDYVAFCGNEMYKDLCLRMADVILEEDEI